MSAAMIKDEDPGGKGITPFTGPGVCKEPIGFLSTFTGADVVGALKIHRVNL